MGLDRVRSRLGWVTILIVALGMTPSVGYAESRKLALLVGVDKYHPGSGFSELRYTVRDVEELAKVLIETGYRPDDVRVLTIKRGAESTLYLPTLRYIQQQIKLILSNRKSEDSILIALTGHGIARRVKSDEENGPSRLVSYFCPLDADAEDLTTLLSLDELYDSLNKSAAGTKMMFVDACRNEPPENRRETIPFVMEPPPPSVAALFACSDGEVAWEDAKLGGGHGVFFHFVIEGLKGAADAEAGNRDNSVTLSELTSFTQEKVLEHVSLTRGKRQMPLLLGSTGRITLRDSTHSQGSRLEPNAGELERLGHNRLPNSDFRTNMPAESTYGKDIKFVYEGVHKTFALHLKPGVWNKADKPTNPLAEVMFVHKSNNIYAMIISERVAAPLEVLRKAAFDNMRSVDKNVHIVEEEARIVGGVDVLCVTSKLTSQGIPLVFHNYYYAGKAGMIQIITWTSENLYEESKAEMDNFLDSFVLLSERKSSRKTTETPSSDKARQLAYESVHKTFALHLKPGVWNKSDKLTNPVAEIMFVHKSNDIYAMIIAEPFAASLEVLKKAAFDNMRSVDKNVQIVEEEARKVGGVDVLCVTSKLTSQGTPLVFHNYYYAGKAGMIQIITWTSENLYEESKAEMDNFLNGFVLLKK